MLADADQRAERRAGRGNADAKIGKRRLLDDRQRKADRCDHEDGAGKVGQHMGNEYAGWRYTDQFGCRDVILAFFDQSSATHRAGELRPVGKADGENQDPDRGVLLLRCRHHPLGDTEHQKCDKNGREGELCIGHPHDDRIRHAAGIAADETGRHADGERQEGRGKRDSQRNATAIKDGGKDITTLVVSAEQEGLFGEGTRLYRRGHPVEKIERGRIERVMRCDQWRKEGGQHQADRQHQGKPGDDAEPAPDTVGCPRDRFAGRRRDGHVWISSHVMLPRWYVRRAGADRRRNIEYRQRD
ncbi:hypothetical protein D3C73_782200 [compost metagenome]